MHKFIARVAHRQNTVGRFCGGVDPVLEKIAPTGLSIVDYCRIAVEASVGDLGVVKPNIAFFEERGVQGMEEYWAILEAINNTDANLPVIGDWKRGDVGPSNEAYHRAMRHYFLPDPQRWLLDAITANPYFGQATWQPFLDDPDHGLIVLCRTSNPGAGEFQDLQVETTTANGFGMAPLYQVVANHVARTWNTNGNCGLVVGATAPTEILEVRQIAPGIFLLIPGVGDQGGDLQTAVANAFSPTADADFVINSSGSWLFAWQKGPFACDPKDFASASAAYAHDLNQQIRVAREKLLEKVA